MSRQDFQSKSCNSTSNQPSLTWKWTAKLYLLVITDPSRKVSFQGVLKSEQDCLYVKHSKDIRKLSHDSQVRLLKYCHNNREPEAVQNPKLGIDSKRERALVQPISLTDLRNPVWGWRL